MGKEFEAKVLITADEFIEIICKLGKEFNLSNKVDKIDKYYSKYNSTEEAIKNNESLTRIRSDSSGVYLTLKNKSIQNGFESNIERETQFADVSVVEQLLKEAGYKEYFTKAKTSYMISPHLKNENNIYSSNIIRNIEVEIISNLKDKKIYAIEIEALSNNEDESIENLKDLVLETFKLFNKTESDFETKSWRELLS
jgi:adenylate cyclase class IV